MNSKKFIVAIIFLGCIIGLFMEVGAGETNLLDATELPEQAIRLRILAHTNLASDQQLKLNVRDALIQWLNQSSSRPQTVAESREFLRERLPEMHKLVQERMAAFGIDYGFAIKLGKVYHPQKTLAGREIPAGFYETLLVTLGSGTGENWWCVIFPPLCLVDESAEEKAKPRFWLWEWLDTWLF